MEHNRVIRVDSTGANTKRRLQAKCGACGDEFTAYTASTRAPAKCKKCGKVLFPPRLVCPACKSREFENTKINMVILDNTTEKEIEAMQAFCRETGLHLQKIMRFSLYDRDDLSRRFQTERPPECTNCNRLRLTADGFLKPCLFSDDEIKVDFNDIEGSIRKAVSGKPKSGTACKNRFMNEIGG